MLSFYSTVIPIIVAFMPDASLSIGTSSSNATNLTRCIAREEASLVSRELFAQPCVALNATVADVLLGGM
eukprot:COSAG02_NODE_1019_length_15171_cov_7.663482_7_plen_70_part_00